MSAAQQVKLEVLEPKGVLSDPKREGLSNPRLTELNGKTIALMSIHVDDLRQFGSELFFEILADMLKERYPDMKFIFTQSFGSPNAKINADEICAQCDAWVEGVKEAITQGRRDVGVYMERAGKPVVHMLGRWCARKGRLPISTVCLLPVLWTFLQRITAQPRGTRAHEGRRGRGDRRYHQALTDPLTEEEKRSFEMEYDYSNKVFTGASYFEANEKFQQYCEANHLTDGLAVTLRPRSGGMDALRHHISTRQGHRADVPEEGDRHC